MSLSSKKTWVSMWAKRFCQQKQTCDFIFGKKLWIHSISGHGRVQCITGLLKLNVVDLRKYSPLVTVRGIWGFHELAAQKMISKVGNDSNEHSSEHEISFTWMDRSQRANNKTLFDEYDSVHTKPTTSLPFVMSTIYWYPTPGTMCRKTVPVSSCPEFPRFFCKDGLKYCDVKSLDFDAIQQF